MRKPEIHQTVLPLQILLGELFPVVVREVEGPPNERAPDALVRFRDAGPRHAGFLVAEVGCHADAGEEEEDAGLPAEGAEAVAGLGFLDGLVGAAGAGGEGLGMLPGGVVERRGWSGADLTLGVVRDGGEGSWGGECDTSLANTSFCQT